MTTIVKFCKSDATQNKNILKLWKRILESFFVFFWNKFNENLFVLVFIEVYPEVLTCDAKRYLLKKKFYHLPFDPNEFGYLPRFQMGIRNSSGFYNNHY